MAYVYRHIRLDKNEPFYVGIGSDDKYIRAKSIKNRNRYWKNIVAMTNYRVDILCSDISWEDACEKEKEFISMYGRKDSGDGTLVNMTDGGEGSTNRKMSESLKSKLLFINKGKKLSESHKNNISINNGASREIIDLATGVVYKSIKDASDLLKISPSHLNNMLNGRRANKTSFAYKSDI
jgi:hypothetical protein